MDFLWRLHLFGSLTLRPATARDETLGAELSNHESSNHEVLNDEVVTRFRTRKAAALLAYLSLHPGLTGREQLATQLWPDAEPNHARASLRTALASLRRQLEPLGVTVGFTTGAVFETTTLAIGLRPGVIVSDVSLFDSHLRAAQEAGVREPGSETQRRHLRAAVALYRGRLLGDFYDDWCEELAAFYEARFCRATQQLIELLRAQKREDEAWEIAGWRTTFGPPGQDAPETFKLERAVPQSASKTGTGEARRPRLKSSVDSARGGEIKATSSALAPAEKASAGAQGRMPRTALPLYTTRFLGRESEIEQLRLLLAEREATTLWTLVGPPGIGKTRLLVEAVRRRLREGDLPGERVLWVPLVALGSCSELGGALCAALGVVPDAASTAWASALGRLSELSQQALEGGEPFVLLLDNLEHLLPEAASLIQVLRLRAPGIIVITTSRAALRLPGERLVPIGALELPASDDPLPLLCERASVQLFVGCAKTARPGFGVTPRNVEAVRGVCARLQGLPLALELAGARAGAFSPAQILEHLDAQLDFLQRATPRPFKHHQNASDVTRQLSLRAAIAWSYRLLPDEIAALLRVLAVFRGGASVDAVEQVWNRPDSTQNAEQGLAHLLGHSLVVCDEHDGALRYNLLEGVREFALEAADAEEIETLRRRHAAFFLDFANAARDASPSEEIRVFERLDAEKNNLRAALAWALEHQPQRALEALATLWRFCESRGLLEEGSVWLQKVLETTQKDTDSVDEAARSRAQSGLAHLLFLRGLLPDALELGRMAENSARRTDDQRALALSLLSQGIPLFYLGRADEARSVLEASLSVFGWSLDALIEPRDAADVATALNYVALTVRVGTAYDQSQRLLEAAIALARDAGAVTPLLQGLFFAGDMLGPVAEHHHLAFPLFQEMLTLSQAHHNEVMHSYALWGLAHVDIARHDFDLARERLAAGAAITRKVKHGWSLLFLCEASARLAAANEHNIDVALLLGAAERAREEVRLPMTESYYAGIHRVAQAARVVLGEDAFARWWQQGRSLSTDTLYDYFQGAPLPLDLENEPPSSPDDGIVYGFPREPEKALPLLAASQFGLGRLARHLGDAAGVRAHFEAAQKLFKQLGDKDACAACQRWLAGETPATPGAYSNSERGCLERS